MPYKISLNSELKSAQMYNYWTLNTVIGVIFRQLFDTSYTTHKLSTISFRYKNMTLRTCNQQKAKYHEFGRSCGSLLLCCKYVQFIYITVIIVIIFFNLCHFVCTVVCIFFSVASVPEKTVTIFRNWNAFLVLFWYA
jgi:hypothetical protein